MTVGKRRDENSVVLKIDSKQAWSDGIKFYHGSENIGCLMIFQLITSVYCKKETAVFLKVT